ncbi:MAG: hypothetical protein JW845_01520, partial [Dehalococcoidales bacterium]|nr:hypothetical protein [Dehalococcoidales bacterium]
TQKTANAEKRGMTPLFCFFQGVFLPRLRGWRYPFFAIGEGRECRRPMAVRGTMAGTLSAVAYSMEVRWDRCTVRTITNESRHFEQFSEGGNAGGET